VTALLAPAPLAPALFASVRAPAPVWATDTIQLVLLVLAGAGATLVALTRVPRRQVVMLSLYGLVLSVVFLALQAPDVALSEITIGAVALPLVLLLALAKMRNEQR
jgi:energy-converting hydrogenase B subunit D